MRPVHMRCASLHPAVEVLWCRARMHFLDNFAIFSVLQEARDRRKEKPSLLCVTFARLVRTRLRRSTHIAVATGVDVAPERFTI